MFGDYVNDMKILFLHGLESGPNSKKAKHLAKNGHNVYAPKLPKESFSESVRIAQEIVDEVKPDCIVGSSRGGAVAMALNAQDSKLVLIAPAWRKYNVPPELRSRAVILHSADDDVIPLSDSFALKASTYVCGEGHRMSDKNALYNLDSVLRI